MKRRYKIINKRRFFIFITLVFAVIIIIALSVLSNNVVHSSIYKIEYNEIEYNEIEYNEIEVVAGDTLWGIAAKYLPENTDIRKLVYEIKKFNKMDNYYIYPGNIIKIPVQYK